MAGRFALPQGIADGGAGRNAWRERRIDELRRAWRVRGLRRTRRVRPYEGMLGGCAGLNCVTGRTTRAKRVWICRGLRADAQRSALLEVRMGERFKGRSGNDGPMSQAACGSVAV